MKCSMIALVFAMAFLLPLSCSSRSESAKKDIDFVFDSLEYVWLTTVEYTRKGKTDEGLDICEKYMKERQDQLAAAGRRMSDDMFIDEVRNYYAERQQKNRDVTDKWEDYISNNLNATQMTRFNMIVAEMGVEKYMSNIKWTTDPWEFFKKALKGKFK